MTTSLAHFWQGTPSATATATGAALTPTSGNLLVAVITGSGSTLASMATAMAAGTTGWTQLIADVGNNTSGTDHAVLGFWYKYASGNETPAFTTGAAGTVTSQCDIYEIAGSLTSGNPLDTSGTYASGSGTSTTISSITATTSAAPAAAGEFAILAAIRERTAVTSTITISTPWTGEYQDGGTSQNGHRADGYQTSPATTGTLSGTISFSGTATSSYGAGAVVVLKAAAGAPPYTGGPLTVTATPTGATSGLLRVLVLTGATENGGAVAAPTGSGPGTVSLTPNFSNSFPVWGNCDFFGHNPFTGATNNVVLDNVSIASGSELASGYYNGTVTATTAITVGGTETDGATSALTTAYEVPASAATTPVLDASSPAAVSETSGSAALTSASFTPPGGSVLVAIVSASGFPSAWAVSSNGSLTWTKQADNTNGVQVWTATVPQTTITNSFEGGTDGTAITTANSGGTSGTAFDSLGGSTTLPVFSAAGAIHGSLGVATPLSGNSTTTIEWKQSFTGFNASSVPWYARDYFKITSLPPAQVFLMKAQDDVVPQDVWAVYLDTTGHLGLRNRIAGTNLATSTGTVALNTPTRWETECSYDGSTYSLTLECFFGANVEGSTPDETLTGSVSSADPVDLAAFGAQAATVQTWSGIYHDDIGLSATGWLGPVPASGGPVSVNGLAAAVAVAAPSGTEAVTTTGPVAGITVAAPAGTEAVTTTGPVARVTVAAPAGTASISMTGPVAAATVAAPAGTAGVTVPGPVASTAASAPAGTAAVAARVGAATVAASAPVGTASAANVVPGPAAQVTASAPLGTVSVSSSVAPAAVTVSAPIGSLGVPGITASVTVAAPIGTVKVSVAGAVASASSAAFPGTASVTVTGPVARVSSAAPTGIPGTAVPGPVASATAQATPGSSAVTVIGPVASVAVAAPAGSAVASANGVVTGRVAEVTVAAPPGSASVTVPGGTFQVAASAPAGTASVSVTGLTASVAASAPMGSVSVTVPCLAAGVTVEAPPGLVSVVVIGPPSAVQTQAPPGAAVTTQVVTVDGLASLVAVQAWPGTVSVSLTGEPATVAVAAPAPVVANLYSISVTVMCDVLGVRTQRVWFGYGLVRTLNVAYLPPKESP